MIAAHGERAADGPEMGLRQMVAREDEGALSFVELVPQTNVRSDPRLMDAHVAVVGDLADRVADFIESTGDGANGRAVAGHLREVAHRVAGPTVDRALNAIGGVAFISRRGGQRDPRLYRSGVWTRLLADR